MSTAVARRRRLAQERLRLRAGRMFERGLSQAVVMHRLEVSRQRVNDWHTAWAAGGLDGLRSHGQAGRKTKNSPEHRARHSGNVIARAAPHGVRFRAGGLPRVAPAI